LIANDISRSDIGFSSDYNEVFVINRSLDIEKIERATKTQIAQKILEVISRTKSAQNFALQG